MREFSFALLLLHALLKALARAAPKYHMKALHHHLKL
jgi:hypothetical protein